MSKSRWQTIGLALVAVVALVGWYLVQADADPDTSPDSPSDQVTSGAVDPDSGLEWVPSADLPAEAQETLALIDAGGPYPERQDGATFENREALLPDEARGYYREYTVETPGSSDRGARRIVVGSDGEFYYTDDHYQSFRRIAR